MYEHDFPVRQSAIRKMDRGNNNDTVNPNTDPAGRGWGGRGYRHFPQFQLLPGKKSNSLDGLRRLV